MRHDCLIAEQFNISTVVLLVSPKYVASVAYYHTKQHKYAIGVLFE